MSLLDRLVEAVEGDVRGAAAAASHAIEASAPLPASSHGLVRIDTDAKALAADGREAVLRGFDLAASAEGLASASGDMTRVLEDAARKVHDALAGARGATGMVLTLARAAEEMAGVVDAVASVARQANLLALHATIEAARAGEAGRGFASVAADVKSLSEETGEAARDVGARIARLRDTAASSVRAVERIMAAVQEAQPSLTAAAAAVEDRNASLWQVAQHATDLSLAVGGMSTKAEQVAALADAAARVVAAGEAGPSLDDLARPLRERIDTTYRY